MCQEDFDRKISGALPIVEQGMDYAACLFDESARLFGLLTRRKGNFKHTAGRHLLHGSNCQSVMCFI